MGAEEGLVVVVGVDVSDGKKVFESTGKVVTTEQRVLTDTTLDESGAGISVAGTPLAVGAKIVIHQVGRIKKQKTTNIEFAA